MTTLNVFVKDLMAGKVLRGAPVVKAGIIASTTKALTLADSIEDVTAEAFNQGALPPDMSWDTAKEKVKQAIRDRSTLRGRRFASDLM